MAEYSTKQLFGVANTLGGLLLIFGYGSNVAIIDFRIIVFGALLTLIGFYFIFSVSTKSYGKSNMGKIVRTFEKKQVSEKGGELVEKKTTTSSGAV